MLSGMMMMVKKMDVEKRDMTKGVIQLTLNRYVCVTSTDTFQKVIKR